MTNAVGLDTRETLKPKLSGYSVNSRESSVLFPAPDGPEIISGRKKSALGGMLVSRTKALIALRFCDQMATW